MAKKEEKTKQKSHYFKDMKAELKKVIWPTPKQLASNTLAVIAFTFIIAVIVFVLDLSFDTINKYGVTPLQSKIQSSYTASKENNDSSKDLLKRDLFDDLIEEINKLYKNNSLKQLNQDKDTNDTNEKAKDEKYRENIISYNLLLDYNEKPIDTLLEL